MHLVFHLKRKQCGKEEEEEEEDNKEKEKDEEEEEEEEEGGSNINNSKTLSIQAVVWNITISSFPEWRKEANERIKNSSRTLKSCQMKKKKD
ncbi:hypothetical protein E2C01_056216 [Portunus trituberculatus]|uniref:Uncharacterized protein n=1 Tax=Portunus trituberculatus TaxID=210409 RepID=A0A5B7GWS2_PORTR|nr:hypothetical protein [Portunus trituberculatus]